MSGVLIIQSASITDADDSFKSLINEAMARFCQFMGKDFVPFLPHVMPNLMKAAESSDIVVTESKFPLPNLGLNDH